MPETKKDTEELLQSASETATYLREYVRLQVDYLRLDLAERMAKVASVLAAFLAIGALLTFGFFIITIALALVLGEWWHSYALGFLAVAGLYLVLAALLAAFREPLLTNPLLNNLFKAFFQNTDEPEHYESQKHP
ncbi:MAG: phage holin family protein [Saprospiraceae bacterium]|nr:phage holin family protein [Saprospiraceae bacterium]MDW8229404.1 phage holin family protein [Saprospiraceae bacterium]